MLQLKQDLPVQLDAFPVGVFDGNDVPLEGRKEKDQLKTQSPDLIQNLVLALILKTCQTLVEKGPLRPSISPEPNKFTSPSNVRSWSQ